MLQSLPWIWDCREKCTVMFRATCNHGVFNVFIEDEEKKAKLTALAYSEHNGLITQKLISI